MASNIVIQATSSSSVVEPGKIVTISFSDSHDDIRIVLCENGKVLKLKGSWIWDSKAGLFQINEKLENSDERDYIDTIHFFLDVVQCT